MPRDRQVCFIYQYTATQGYTSRSRVEGQEGIHSLGFAIDIGMQTYLNGRYSSWTLTDVLVG